MNDVYYGFIPGRDCSEDILRECSVLFSEHYGEWSPASGKTGNVTLSPQRIRAYLSKPDTSLYYSAIDGKIVGYAIAFRHMIDNYGYISWVTQLVVHKDFRRQGIATNILLSIWQMSDDFAWGIVTSNPYAVRALETATRRESIPVIISDNLDAVMLAAENTTYITQDIEKKINDVCSQLNTKFNVSHDRIEERLANVTKDGRKWRLGDTLDEGWEWAAFTFREQQPAEYTAEEAESLMERFDAFTKSAYEMMPQSAQPWAKHTAKETDYILSYVSPVTAIDFGCGEGRHSAELYKRGIKVTAVDYTKSKTSHLKQMCPDVDVICGDCRDTDLGITVDLVICLYDVIGSFAELHENQRIIDNIARHLKKGGTAFISVMNYERVEHTAKHRFVFAEEYSKLLELGSSSRMSTTGDVFDPDEMYVDTAEHVIYRRERFEFDGIAPTEHIVRDRRFTGDELADMCTAAGLSVQSIRYVNAGWDNDLPPCEAKEILVRCIKP